MPAPRIETPRLILRPFRAADFDVFAAYWSDPDVTRWSGGRLIPRSESWSRFKAHIGHWELLGYGFWALEEKASGAMIGEVGLIDLMPDYPAAVAGVPEIGWVLSKAAQGKGYATEAARAVVVWGHAHLGPVRVIAAVNIENVASINVAQKCGFAEVLREPYARGVAVYLERTL